VVISIVFSTHHSPFTSRHKEIVMPPTRYTELNLAALRQKHGPRADTAVAYLSHADPCSDEMVALFSQMPPQRGTKMFNQALEYGIDAVPQPPKPLRDFFDHVEAMPLWLDKRLLELGTRTLLRCGVFTGIVLGCSCLPLSYRSGAGTKALMFTGELSKRSIRRLSETNRFFLETCLPDGMQRGKPGWKMTVRIRVMHASMRRLLRQSKNKPWNEEAWGLPINQMDLAATQLLFSASLLQHLRRLGFHFSAQESYAVMHLWRYSGHLLGVVPELLCSTEDEGCTLLKLLLDVTGRPDMDSLVLTEALMKTAMPIHMAAILPWLLSTADDPGELRSRKGLLHFCRLALRRLGLRVPPEVVREQMTRLCYGLSHGIVGDQVASDLNYPGTSWRSTAPLLLRSFIAPLETCRRLIPGGTSLAYWFGHRQIQRLMKTKLFARRPHDMQTPDSQGTPKT
jgi:hypothetical protein